MYGGCRTGFADGLFVYRNFFTLLTKLNYITPKEAADKWGISLRRVQMLCAGGQIPGAERLGERTWAIPKDAPKPLDGRTKEAKRGTKVTGG
jgi:hypothetical protein